MMRTAMTVIAATLLLTVAACGGSTADTATSVDSMQSSASTLRYERLVMEWPHEEFDAPAGEVCDFHLSVAGDGGQKGGRFYDANGVRVKAIWEVTEINTFRNLDTGYTLHETINYTIHRDFLNLVEARNGVSWQTRDADGRLVILSAGRVVEAYDLETGSFAIIFKTAKTLLLEDWAQVMVPALRGTPGNLLLTARVPKGRKP